MPSILRFESGGKSRKESLALRSEVWEVAPAWGKRWQWPPRFFLGMSYRLSGAVRVWRVWAFPCSGLFRKRDSTALARSLR